MKYKFSKKEAVRFRKSGVEMWVYSDKNNCDKGNLIYQEVDGGHNEEFLNSRSAFIYYIVEGRGIFVIEDEEIPVEAGDTVIVPPGKRFYYLGKMKQVLVTAPAWEEGTDKIIKKIII